MNDRISLRNLTWEYEQIQDALLPAMEKLMVEGSFINGIEVERFEAAFASFTGAKYCVGVSSGTDALMIALLSIGVRPGDEVITTALTFVATIEAILHVGAVPVIVDVDKRGLIDPERIEEAITEKTKAILPVHLYGIPCNMRRISAICKKHGLLLLNDAAQAHGTIAQGKALGSIGNATCYSFMPAKTLGAFGDAGAIVTNDMHISDKARRLRNHGRTDKYNFLEIGYCARMDALQAVVLTTKLGHLADWIKKRREIALVYNETLEKNVFELPSQNEKKQDTNSYYVYPVILRGEKANRDWLLTQLSLAGIETNIYYPQEIPAIESLKEKVTICGTVVNAQHIAKHVFAIPMNPSITVTMAKKIATTVNSLATSGDAF